MPNKKKKENQWVDITDYDNDVHTYRVEFSCSSKDLDSIIDDMTCYGEILKVERRKGD